MVSLFFFITPFAIALLFFAIYSKSINIKELVIQIIIQLVFCFSFITIVYNLNTSDTETFHSSVSKKYSQDVSCSHSYRCRCYTTCSGSGSNRTCSEHCSTCYDHSFDREWIVESQHLGNVEIATIDRQGLEEPPRYSIAKVGEHFSKNESYENYIKGNPESLFRKQGLVKKYKTILPPYFGSVYDYYRNKRFINISQITIPDFTSLISEANQKIGPQFNGSLGLVIVSSPRDFYYALDEHWLGGRKNDIIPVISLNKDGTIQWVEIMGWFNDPIFKIKLRDDLFSLKTLDNETKVMENILHNIEKYYVQKPIKDFAYLKSSIKPTINQWIIGFILSIIISISCSVVMIKYDLFKRYNN